MSHASLPAASAVNFPIFHRMTVTGYGLYPGTPARPGLDIEFKSGLTLVVGTNGLGKTTLVTLLYRMLSGGFDLRQSTLSASELGGASLEVFRLPPKQRALFADRVSDRASDAQTKLEIALGATRVSITRRMDNLDLIAVAFDGIERAPNETELQGELVRLAGLSSFGDWLIFLRQLVFYFEDRRSLVWDASAQRQVFRMLFLPPDEAKAFYEQEREILELDSQVRNLSAALYRLQNRIAQDDRKQEAGVDIRSHIRSLTPLLEHDLNQKAQLLEQLDSLDEQRRARRRDLLASEDLASRLQEELEDNRLRIVHGQFPGKAETAKYLLSLLMSDGHCAVCSSERPAMAAELNQRVNDLACIVCGAPLQTDVEPTAIMPDQATLARLRGELEIEKRRIDALRDDLRVSSERYELLSSRLIQLTVDIAARERLLETLVASLPADEQQQMRAKDELATIKAKITDDRVHLDSLSSAFTVTTTNLNTRVQEQAAAIKAAFARYAEGFLFESVDLKWSPHLRRLGQLQKIESASFDLDMSGTDFQQTQRRDGPGAVSESQREFIDLAFRMALIEVAGQGLGGSLIIDAPESSLDAVFVERAAQVLCRFGHPESSNRLVIASNLVDGRLLPDLIRYGVPAHEHAARLLNLMDVAVPTAAVRAEEAKYRTEWEAILKASAS